MVRKSRLHTVIRAALLGVLVSALPACVPPVKPVSDAEIQAARKAGELKALYLEVQRELKKQPKNRTLLETMGKIARALQTQEKFEELRTLIEDLRTEEGVLPSIVVPADDGELSVVTHVDSLLERKLGELASDDDVHQNARNLIGEEVEKRNELVRQKTVRLDALPPENLSERLSLVEDVFILGGDTALREDNHEAVLAGASRQAFIRMEQEQYREASALFQSILEEDPDFPEVKDGLSQANFKVHLEELERYREQGDVDNVYRIWLRMISDATDQRLIDQLRPAAIDLVNYFNLSAQSSMLNGDLLDAWRGLLKTEPITRMIDLPSVDRSFEQDFVTQIFILSNEARNSGDLGLAMGYLSAIEDFDDSNADVKRMLDDVRRELYESGVVKIVVSSFESPANAPGLGAVVTASLTRHFIKGQYQDINILDRQGLDEIMQEGAIGAMKGDTEINLSPSDYLIQGAVLGATVDTTVQEIQNTKRVVVEVKRTPNPAYDEWSKLPRQQKDRRTAPPSFLIEEVKENISFTRRLHSKLGSVTVNFRIIDPVSAGLLHVDTLKSEEDFKDESLDGIEVGRFVQKAKAASLPPDSKILGDLTNSLAEKIAIDIARQLENPERRYLSAAKELETEGKLTSAAEELGKAIAILEAKGQPVEAEMTTLKQWALQLH